MTATDRPTGVLGLAVVAVIVGVTDILAGLGDIGIAGGFLSDHGFGEKIDGVMNVVGVALVAVGVLGLATGFGLLRGKNWAWLITRLWASVCIVAGARRRRPVAAQRHDHESDPRHHDRLHRHGDRRRRRALVPLPAGGAGRRSGAPDRAPDLGRTRWPELGDRRDDLPAHDLDRFDRSTPTTQPITVSTPRPASHPSCLMTSPAFDPSSPTSKPKAPSSRSRRSRAPPPRRAAEQLELGGISGDGRMLHASP